MHRHAIVLALASLLFAQSSPSRLTIVVEDPSGAPIPGASVHVQHWVFPRGRPGSVGRKPRLIQDGDATTDGQGRVSFRVAPARYYDVSVFARAFVPAAASVSETSHVFKLAVGGGGGVEVVNPSK